MSTGEGAPLLEVSGLTVSFATERGQRSTVTADVGLEVRAGRITALVGESGSGKSVTALALMRLLPRETARIDGGSIMLRDGEEALDLVTLNERRMQDIRGRRIGMIFQEPMSSLNPVLTIGEQVEEVIRLRGGVSRRGARDAAAEALREAGAPDAALRMRSYPHEFSGGMRQRALIAIALAHRPRVLIADEPTTALDATLQAGVLDLLRGLGRARGLGVLLITHSLDVVARAADSVSVMCAGRIVESSPVEEALARPMHPYTRGLLACAPRLRTRRRRLATVGEFTGDEGAFELGRVKGAPAGARAWWPTHTPPVNLARRDGAAGDTEFVEAAPGHFVRVWRTAAIDAR